MQIPRATYRLQFHEKFRLADAERLVPYLHDLGISHVYASPLFLASPHSAHGYDVCDFSRLNPEIGTETDLEKLAGALHAKKMGLILDIVPNHMGISSPENRWWWDVLAKGRKSPFAACFDIDWTAADRDFGGKILVPILGDSYEAILEKGELKVLRAGDEFVLGYHEHRLPLASSSAGKLPADVKALELFNEDRAAVDKLIKKQNYQLEFYEKGDSQLNYRRFFAISTLAAVRVEDAEVFAATHALVRRWCEKGWVDGLRVDHPDGLRDPAQYLQRLRALIPNGWIVIEKILGPGEDLSRAWPIAGTTGYDFLSQTNSLFVDGQAEGAFTKFYVDFTGEPPDYWALVREKKRMVLQTMLVAERDRLVELLSQIAGERPRPQEFTRDQWQTALTEIIACFPVYRSYLPEGHGAAQPADAQVINEAIQLAAAERKDLPEEVFVFIRSLLVEVDRPGRTGDFVARFQQLTGAVMAKGAEDTAFYCFNRFVSLNEVGGDPAIFGMGGAEYHERLQRRQKLWPHSQLASSTHDTKRSEDVRARLNVLSEIPEVWGETVRRWSAMNACHRRDDFPDRNAEYLFYQTLVGAWPLSVDRAQAYMEKAVREAKQHTAWTRQNQVYEKALQSFISETLRDPQFTADLEKFAGALAVAAATNSLAQTLIRLTAPGVPDIYQGCELWDGSLVDPDNRRAVDFDARQRLLAEGKLLSPEAVWNRRPEGLPKMWLMQKTLKLRERHPEFSEYDYQPLTIRGVRGKNVFAYLRGGAILVAVPRFVMKVNRRWEDTRLELPAGIWESEFTGDSHDGGIEANTLFAKFPVALLVRKEKI